MEERGVATNKKFSWFAYCFIHFSALMSNHTSTPPLNTVRKLNLHKMFRKVPGRLLNVLCTFNLCPVCKWTVKTIITVQMRRHSKSFMINPLSEVNELGQEIIYQEFKRNYIFKSANFELIWREYTRYTTFTLGK